MRVDRPEQETFPLDRRDDLRDAGIRQPDEIAQRSGRAGTVVPEAAEQHRLVDRQPVTLGKDPFELVQSLVDLLDPANGFHLLRFVRCKDMIISNKNYFY